MKRPLIIFAVLAGTGCAGLRRSVDAQMIVPPFGVRQDIHQDERYLMASPIEDAPPAYPSQLRKQRQERVSVCVEIVIDAEGRVASASLIPAMAECVAPASAVHAPFVSAAMTAVNAWSFYAAAICSISVEGGECDGDSPDLRPVPSKLAYVFTFENTDGRPKVAATRR